MLTPAQQELAKKKSAYFFLVQMTVDQTDSGKVLVRQFVQHCYNSSLQEWPKGDSSLIYNETES